jgi:hypothetical protein
MASEFARHAFLVLGLVEHHVINDAKVTSPSTAGTLEQCLRTALCSAGGMSLDDQRQTTSQILYKE